MVRANQQSTARSHATLDELMRLRGRALGFSLLPRQPPGGALAGRHSSRLRGRGLDFAELRRYQDGDDIRAMDWLATARLRAPHVRVYTEERDRIALLVVDQRLTMFFGSRCATKSVAAAEVGALAAWRINAVGDRVAAIVFDDREHIVVRPSRGQAAVQTVLSEMARFNARLSAAGGASNPAMLNHALAEAARLATHDWLIVLISDAAGADDATRRLVTRMAAHNDVVAVFVSDKLEAALPSVGPVVLAEGTARLAINTASERLRQDHAAHFAERRAQINAFSRHRTIPVVDVYTDQDVGDQIRMALHPRQSPR